MSAPLQNRVLPTGEIVAVTARGTFTGNRGILHRKDRSLGPSRWQHPHWVTCTLDHPRGVYHGPMPDRAWTALFFLDEAVALAAGHRPCNYCRRPAYKAWRAAWEATHPGPFDRIAMDRSLHRARVSRTRAQIRHSAPCESLPDGTFILWKGNPAMILGAALRPYTPQGYGPPLPCPEGVVTVLTPAPTIDVLRFGYRPALHATVGV